MSALDCLFFLVPLQGSYMWDWKDQAQHTPPLVNPSFLLLLDVKLLVLKTEGNYILLLELKFKYKIVFMLSYNGNQNLKFIVFYSIKICVHLRYIQLQQ